jgi:UDP:flavonoid glycosyltransferase YjiC (YdhE family)
MASILFVTWDGGGNLPPALGVAAELAARGHDVRMLGHRSQQEAISRAGLSFKAFPTARDFDARAVDARPPLLAIFGDRAMGADVLAEDAELYVIDCLLFGAMDAVRRAGRPYVVLGHLYDRYLQARFLPGPMGIGLRLKRLAPRRSLLDAEQYLVCSLPGLDPGHNGSQPANVAYAGPVVAGEPSRAKHPTVLVSLSTNNFPGQRRVLENVLGAVADLPARVVVTTGPHVYDGLHVPDNVELHGYVPHAELMPEVSMVVGHGGHGTTMAALAHDLPLLVLPMLSVLDQGMVGRSVQEAGAGRLLRKKSSPERLRPVIAELMSDGPHRAAAARLGAAIRGARGQAVGADLVESHVASGRS